MNSININDSSKIKGDLSKKINAITLLCDGKRFKTYVAWSFAEALNCKKYVIGAKYSFLFEAQRLYDIINIYYKDEAQKNAEMKKMKTKVEQYLNNSKDLLIQHKKDSESSSATPKDIQSTNKNNINNDSKKVNKKSIDDIKGDFDVIIPNAKRDDFMKILENNFYSKSADKCIVYDESKIKALSEYFHLFIEVGISSFDATYKHKIQQIRKYISIVNFAKNIIEDDEIRTIYKNNFKERFNLNLNSNNSQIADTVVFMLISNNSYGEFTRRFLDNRNSLNLENNDELNSIAPKTSEDILLCGFVDFPKVINAYQKNELLKEIKEQKNKMDEMKKELDYLKFYINNNSAIDKNYESTLNIDNNSNYYDPVNDDNYRNNFYFGHNNYNYDYNDYYFYNYHHYYGNNHYFNNFYHY